MPKKKIISETLDLLLHSSDTGSAAELEVTAPTTEIVESTPDFPDLLCRPVCESPLPSDFGNRSRGPECENTRKTVLFG